MTSVLSTLLSISLSMSAAIVLLLLLGPLLARWYRPHWRYWAWLAVALRLLIPLHLSADLAPIQLEAPPADGVVLAPPAGQSGGWASPGPTEPAGGGISALSTALPTASISQTGQEGQAVDEGQGSLSGQQTFSGQLASSGQQATSGQSTFPDQQTSPGQSTVSGQQDLPDAGASSGQASGGPVLTLGAALTALWGLGAGVVLAWHLVGLARFTRYVRRWAVPFSCPEGLAMLDRLRADLGLKRHVPVFLCPGVDSPMLAGLFRPRILLPQQPPQGEALWFALRHELLHQRRHDIPYKALLLLANCVHWFNPLVWVMRSAADQDMELCCDAGVIAGLSRQQRVDYGQAILSALGRAVPPGQG